MRWRNQRRSDNIEDQRGRGGRASMGLPIGRKFGAGTIVLVLGAFLLGADPSTIIGMLMGGGGGSVVQSGAPAPASKPSAAENELADFVSVVLADTETTWQGLFRQAGLQYREPRLVLFSGATRSGCGAAQSAMGPFYCPADQKVYIDLDFYRQLRSRHNAPGDFAQAYVIAHEVGHHVQTLLGIASKVHQARQRLPQVEGNKMQVKMELQADCLAGIWAAHADKRRNLLEMGDLDEAINAARQIGDDTLQRQAQGRVIPESFTHGSSEQRAYWFKRGFTTTDMNACDTFG